LSAALFGLVFCVLIAALLFVQAAFATDAKLAQANKKLDWCMEAASQQPGACFLLSLMASAAGRGCPGVSGKRRSSVKINLSFPPIFFAPMFGHAQDAMLLEFEDSAAIQAAPKVSF